MICTCHKKHPPGLTSQWQASFFYHIGLIANKNFEVIGCRWQVTQNNFSELWVNFPLKMLQNLALLIVYEITNSVSILSICQCSFVCMAFHFYTVHFLLNICFFIFRIRFHLSQSNTSAERGLTSTLWLCNSTVFSVLALQLAQSTLSQQLTKPSEYYTRKDPSSLLS